MRKKLLLPFLAITIVTYNCAAQNASLEWVKTIGTAGTDLIQSQISRDAAGNFYMYVHAENGADLDFGTGTFIVNGSGFYLVKYDAIGNFTWYFENPQSFTIDKSGNVYISGTFDNSYDFDPGLGVTHINSLFPDFCIAKYSTDKVLLWVSDIKGADVSSFVGNSGFVTDNDGNCYVNGYVEGSIDFDPSSNVATLQGASNQNYFVAAYNANGEYKWAFKINIDNPTHESPGLSFGNNSIYMFGTVRVTADLDPGAGNFNVTGNSLGGNSFMARYDKNNGSFISGFGLTSNDHANYAFWLTADSSNNIVMMGFNNGPIDLDPGPGVANIAAGGWYIAKYGNNGSYIWGNQLTAPGLYSFSPSSIVIDQQNNILLSGADYKADSFNVAVVKLNPAGSHLWNFKLNHFGGHDTGPGLAIDGIGNFYVAGFFSTTLDFDPGTAVSTTISMGMQDAFFAKYTDNTSTVAVSLLDFSGEIQGKQNVLQWSTSSETTNTGFEIQRSCDGIHFMKIDFVKSHAIDGNSSLQLDYTYADICDACTTNYYRLKQIDKDGKFIYSNIVVLKNYYTMAVISAIYPNPVRNNMQVEIIAVDSRLLTLQVIDINGRIMNGITTQVGNGKNLIQLNVAQLPGGTYFLKVFSKHEKKSMLKKFIKL